MVGVCGMGESASEQERACQGDGDACMGRWRCWRVWKAAGWADASRCKPALPMACSKGQPGAVRASGWERREGQRVGCQQWAWMAQQVAGRRWCIRDGWAKAMRPEVVRRDAKRVCWVIGAQRMWWIIDNTLSGGLDNMLSMIM